MSLHRHFALAALLLLTPVAVAQADTKTDVAAGRALYLTGEREDGTRLTAIVQQDVALPGAGTACANCHRRSGLGTSEGSVRSLPITAAALFRAPLSKGARPAYDDMTLRRAITQGVSANGAALDPTMPRYALTDQDAHALIAYLRGLGSTAPPGVSGDTIELATVISDSAPPERRDAVLKVIERYVEIKNSGTRREGARAAAARRHPLGEKRDRAFRRWNLTVWQLKGPPATWDAQLRRYYAARAPFALLSGITDHDWRVVHGFCERVQMPCILPVTETPGDSSAFYSLYFSSGAALEASVTARHIQRTPDEPAARVMLLYTDNERASTARMALRAALDEQGMQMPVEHAFPSGTAPTYRQWQDLLGRERPDVLIAWLEPSQLHALASAAISAELMPRRIYTAESISPWRSVASLAAIRSRVWHVYPYRVPVAGRSQFPREQAWLKAQGLEALERETASRALFACHALGEGLMSIDNNFSREYLLEQLEHMLDGTAMTTLYPATHLGAGQRVLSRGAYVTRLGGPTGAAALDPEWLVP